MALITFNNPIYLIFLISVPLLIITHFFTLQYLQRRALKFANFEAIRRVTGSDQTSVRNTYLLSRNLVLLIFRVLVLIFLIFSASGPVLWTNQEASEFSYVLAIDSSSSMLARDYDPNRLEAAKQAATIFVENLGASSKIGLVSFAGLAYIESPVVEDMKIIKAAITTIRPSTTGGTDLTSAIVQAGNLLITEDKAKVLILLTDGQSTTGASIEDGIKYALDNRITIHTIGVGTSQGGTFLRTQSVSRLDEESLITIAAETGGSYFRADDSASLRASFNEITKATTELVPLRLSVGLMVLALLFLFLEWGLMSTKFRSIP